ncbi:MAG: Fic family protein [Proteobacteria bacterium]|nr:Fic family protein [Pseudomonadota bacterium]
MSEALYDAHDDPACYPGTRVLRNIPGLREPEDLEQYEAMSFALRALQPLPAGRFGLSHYRAIHRHLFGDVYRWAGRFRTVRISKPGAAFCFPEHIDAQMRELFERLRRGNRLRGLDREAFAAEAAAFLAWLNHIHPFREGNGRTQMTFMAALAAQAGHPLNLEVLEEARFLDAMIQSFHGDEAPLRGQLLALIDHG